MMAENVVKFYAKDSAKDPNVVLERAMGDYRDVLIIGWDVEGYLDVRASLGLKDGGEILWLLEKVKKNLLEGLYSENRLADD